MEEKNITTAFDCLEVNPEPNNAPPLDLQVPETPKGAEEGNPPPKKPRGKPRSKRQPTGGGELGETVAIFTNRATNAITHAMGKPFELVDNYAKQYEVKSGKVALKITLPGEPQKKRRATAEPIDLKTEAKAEAKRLQIVKRLQQGIKGLRPSTRKLFDVCVVLLSRQVPYKCAPDKNINLKVQFPLLEYAKLRGIEITKASMDKLRRQTLTDFTVLQLTLITWYISETDRGQANIGQDGGISNGMAYFMFGDTIARYLANGYVTNYPTGLLKTDDRNPNAYALGQELYLHANMNNNVRKGTAERLSVPSVLSYCPAIPSYEEVRETNRSYKTRIINPLLKTLKSLGKTTLESWTFERADGVSISPEAAAKYPYEDFVKLYINYRIRGSDPTTKIKKASENPLKKES